MAKPKPRKRLIEFRERLNQSKSKRVANSKQGDKFQPQEDGPTIGQAKALLRNKYEKQGFFVKKVRYYPAKDKLVVDFGLSPSKTFISGNKMGNGPYGLEKATHDWSTVMKLYKMREDVK